MSGGAAVQQQRHVPFIEIAMAEREGLTTLHSVSAGCAGADRRIFSLSSMGSQTLCFAGVLIPPSDEWRCRGPTAKTRSIHRNRNGGEGGIRTLGEFDPTSDFESGAIDHSTTSPCCGTRKMDEAEGFVKRTILTILPTAVYISRRSLRWKERPRHLLAVPLLLPRQ